MPDRLRVRWADDSDQAPQQPMDCAILFAPAGEQVPKSLAQLQPGRCVVCAGIRLTDIPSFAYRLPWMVRRIRRRCRTRRRVICGAGRIAGTAVIKA